MKFDILITGTNVSSLIHSSYICIYTRLRHQRCPTHHTTHAHSLGLNVGKENANNVILSLKAHKTIHDHLNLGSCSSLSMTFSIGTSSYAFAVLDPSFYSAASLHHSPLEYSS